MVLSLSKLHPLQRWRAIPDNLRGALLLVVGCGLFSLVGALIKIAGARLPSFEVVFFRTVIQMLILVPMVARGGLRELRTRRPGLQVVRGLLATVSISCFFFAVTRMPLADVYAISFGRNLLITVLAVVFLKETVDRSRWGATLVGFAGIVVILQPGAQALDWPVLAAITSMVFAAFIFILIRKMGRTETTISMIAYPMAIVSVAVSIPTALFWVTPSPWELLVMLGVGVSGLTGQWAFINAYRIGEASALAPIDYSRLLFVTVLGITLFGEVPDGAVIIGSLILVASTVYSVRHEGAKRKRNDGPTGESINSGK